ncbi:MAG: hypothetical protein ABI806_23265 [Candidatus Solibacter sp.]
MSTIQSGDFVHVVATVNMKTGDGKILYVNPSTSTVQSDAAREANVELVAEDAAGQPLHREAVVVRRSSGDGGDRGDVGLIQSDLPRVDGMKSIALLFNGKEVSRYAGGEPAPAAQPANLGLAMTPESGPHRRLLELTQAGQFQPVDGVTYSVQVKPDTDGHWNTIAVGRPTPDVEIDRNQFPNATKAEVRVLRTTGFDEQVIAHETVDLF